jgi:hypothetical protein
VLTSNLENGVAAKPKAAAPPGRKTRRKAGKARRR